MKKRKHQLDLTDLARQIRNGREVRNILAYITQGAGKSSIAQIMAAELAEPEGYKICWVVPRHNLRSQGVDNFSRNDMRELFGNTMPLIEAHNYTRLDDLDVGYVTTYQAITADPAVHQMRFSKGKWILILDECHHVPAPGSQGEEAAYYEHISPLVEKASIRVFATGSITRHDDQRIAFLPYQEAATGWIVDETPGGDWAIVKYLRNAAEEENAVVKLEFILVDGLTTWADKKEDRIIKTKLRTAHITQVAPAINTALESQIAHDVLDRTVAHWKEMKTTQTWAKLLVVASSVKLAELYTRYLRNSHGVMAIKADYIETNAKLHIDRFRGKEKPMVDALVTVAMAYEGLDESRITHVALLTNIRSGPWIEQAASRANRIHPGKPRGYVFCLDDPLLARVITYMEHQGAQFVPDLPAADEEEAIASGFPKARNYVPLGSEADAEARIINLGEESRSTRDDVELLDLLSKLLHRADNDKDIENLIRMKMKSLSTASYNTTAPVGIQIDKLIRQRVSHHVSVMAGGNQQKRVAILSQIKKAHNDLPLKRLTTDEMMTVLNLLTNGKLPVVQKIDSV